MSTHCDIYQKFWSLSVSHQSPKGACATTNLLISWETCLAPIHVRLYAIMYVYIFKMIYQNIINLPEIHQGVMGSRDMSRGVKDMLGK